MKEIQFNLNERPKTEAEHAAYLVDKTNVDLIQQYIENYYSQAPNWYKSHFDGFMYKSRIDWYNRIIADKIRQNPEIEYILYFGTNSIGWDDAHDTVYEAIAYSENYDIYHVVPPITVIEIE